MKNQTCINEVNIECGNVFLQVKVISDKIIRITRSKDEIPDTYKSYIVEGLCNMDADCKISENEEHIEIETDFIRGVILKGNQSIVFSDRDGNVILKEININDSDMQSKAVFEVPKTIQYYGLGQQQKGILGYKGMKVEIKHDNTTIAIPFLLTNERYGILWDNSGRVWADFTREEEMRWESETGDVVDYYFIYGPQMNEIIEGYWNLTGPAPMIPKSAFGFWQSKMRYMSQKELMDVAEKYREKQYPMDIIVVDFYHWTEMGDFKFNLKDWPDPEGMFKRLKELNVMGMISVWPYITEKSINFDPMKKDDLLVKTDKGEAIKFTIFNGEKSGLYDPFNPEARKYIWEKAKNYCRQGARIWWLDSCEPDDGLNVQDFVEAGMNTIDGPLEDRINAYALLHEKAFYEGQKAEYPDQRVLILARAAFAGCQRYGVTVWSGDIGYDFKALKSQITAGLNATMSGLPFWTTDIGGFQGGDPKDTAYRELYIRWFQYGAFCPLFRVHGSRGATCFEDLLYGISRGENELWSFGEDLEKIMVKYDRLRYQLLPYIYSCAKTNFETGLPLMRALVLDFSEDKKAAGVADQYMFGSAFMVCPVIEAGATSREVYLPQGCDWYDFWSEKRYAGGQTITADAPIDHIPVYVKAGSIVPIGPVQQYAGEIKKPDLQLNVYPGVDGCFQLYGDDGETFAYERGEFGLIEFKWSENEKKLSVGNKAGDPGDYFGEIKQRVI